MCKVFRRALLIIVKQKGIFISKYAFFALFLVPSKKARGVPIGTLGELNNMLPTKCT
jgi:hypothetical protein